MTSEEVTAERIDKLLGMIPNNAYLSGAEKAILCNDGTVQTMLSVIYGKPIRVEVIHQEENKYYIMRWVRLVSDDVTVCIAQSVINKSNYDGFLTGIREQNMGIGQIISSLGINTRRMIRCMYADDNTFSRVYQIEEILPLNVETEHKLDIIITESFPRMQNRFK